MLLPLLYVLVLAWAVSSSTVSFPLDDQRPSIARSTFSSPAGGIQLSVSPLPTWLSFDPSTMTFSGNARRQGRRQSRNHNDGDGLRNIPLSNQFSSDNPALSSVFVVSPDSALATSNPALRIPYRWSFSIGFPVRHVQSETQPILRGLASERVWPPRLDGIQLEEFDFKRRRGLFNNSLSTADDFAGVLIDGVAVVPTNISSLSIDTSSCGWANFDSASWMLSGNPPSDLPGERIFFPVVISTFFGQVLRTNVSLAIVADQSGDVKLSAAFAADGAGWLTFDPTTASLSGTAPDDFSGSLHVTFTAYSSQTHSTSHTSVDISKPSSGKGSKGYAHPNNLSVAAHKKLVLALGIVFGVIGGVCALGTLLAAFRRCARIDDPAKTDEEGRKALSDSDKRWYGIVDEEKGYGYGSRMPRSAMDLQNPFGPGAELVTPVRGLGLRRVAERSGSDPISLGSPQSPGVMRKGEFMTRIRQTVRNVSEKYGSRRQASDRPIISKPMLIPPTPGLPFETSPSNPFEDSNIISYPGSTVMTNSPSTSTGEHSIPRRRADFAPPKSPALVHFQDGLVRQPSSGSLSSNEEAVVQVASKATSIRSGISHQSAGQRPRLVPFTSATRVPIPRVPSLSVEDPSGSPSRRVTSQRAMVLKEDGLKRSPTADELSMAIHYVCSLGADQPDVNPDPSTPTVSTNLRSSFSSLESSHHGHASAGSLMRTLVRAGEKFKFRVTVSLYSATSYKKGRKLEAKLMSGKPLPKFLHVDLKGNKHSGAVEFYGMPGPRDLGEFNVAVYTIDDGACVGRVVVEVVAASR
ncbi:hypothetical protein C8F04DRAFT_1366400 [Mycena alexandri]|uniref:Dystroglycan-type cadherin-like domain-containing protein n=1 Tax=Mycena alexandri TaxID=1745969 RepID=A0AAD6TBL6_9AGAR|nr:hypothetical protein C8F04DRAFT_1366400 [Mycena alexandri]